LTIQIQGAASVLPDHRPMIFYRTALAIALVICVVPPIPASAKQQRSTSVKREFQLTHPCPANCHRSGTCPGYIKDHLVPLACGGPDTPSNMQWQTTSAGKAKDKWETRGCAR